MKRFLTLCGLLLAVSGAGAGGYAGLDLWRRVAAVGPAQESLDRALDTAWSTSGARAAETGAPIARLHVPALGLRLVVVEGAGDPQLATGPGRIAGTAGLDASGNAGVAAHRQPGLFWDLDRLRAGDPVIVETREGWDVYRVSATRVVRPDDSWVLAATPVPVLTLVTCEPKLSTSSRLIRQASLDRRVPRIAGPPDELQPIAHGT